MFYSIQYKKGRILGVQMFEKCDSSNGIRTITAEENCPLVRVRVWVRVRVSFKVRG